MTYLAVLTAAGLIASIIADDIKTLHRLRPAVVPTQPAYRPIDR